MYEVYRSGLQIGMKTLSDAFHVRWKTIYEETTIASFWICEKQSERQAKLLATAMVEDLNNLIIDKKAKKQI